MEFQLRVVSGARSNQAIPLQQAMTTIGRLESCQIHVKSSQVSRRHCLLRVEDDQVVIRDLGSSNGTYVNKQKIEEDRKLEAGDLIHVGPIRFRIELIGAATEVEHGSQPILAEAVADNVDADDLAIDALAVDETESIDPLDSREARKIPSTGETEELELEFEAEDQEALGEDAVADFLAEIDLEDENSK